VVAICVLLDREGNDCFLMSTGKRDRNWSLSCNAVANVLKSWRVGVEVSELHDQRRLK
jgi:hypothetical protein